MKLKKETETKIPAKKANLNGTAPPVPSALQMTAPKSSPAFSTSPDAKSSRKTKPIKITSVDSKLKSEKLTTVRANIDVGFGNSLYIRGTGDGLSWDEGTPLECIDASTWAWSTTKAGSKIEFKLLLNDTVWAQGENITVTPGDSIQTSPAFN